MAKIGGRGARPTKGRPIRRRRSKVRGKLPCGEIDRRIAEYKQFRRFRDKDEQVLVKQRLKLAKRIQTKLAPIEKLLVGVENQLLVHSRDERLPGPDKAIENVVSEISSWVVIHEGIRDLGESFREPEKELTPFDELCLGIYLHLRKSHFQKGASDIAVIGKTAEILDAEGIADITRIKEGEQKYPYDYVYSPSETPIGKRLWRILHDQDKQKFIRNYQDLPCEFTPIDLDDLDITMDETQQFKLMIMDLRP
jgi:hypothetical protein